ncbi:MAG: alpha/beta hydrolase-fold protein [Pseudomonadota bacterium]
MGKIRITAGAVCCTLIFLLGCSPTAQNDSSNTLSPPAPVQLEGTLRHHMTSEAIGEQYVIDVYVPPNATEAMPVVYLTDGNTMFPIVLNTMHLLRLGNELPPLILVGIGYQKADQSISLRNRDLTPTADERFLQASTSQGPAVLPQAQPGGADAYLDFIRDQVKPFIESNYPAKPGDDTLMGDSLGGLFTLHALFTRPTEYARYVAGSPSLWWDEGVSFATEANYAQTQDDLQARVFLSVGSLEESPGSEEYRMVSNMHKMADILESRSYPSLQLTRVEFDGETHLSVIPATFGRGLRAVFAEDDVR